MFFHSSSTCEIFLEIGKCQSKGCSKRHPKDCRFWTREEEGCRRKDLCQYLHNITKRFKTQIPQNNLENLPATEANHGDIIYNCVQCEYTTNLSENLETHITVNHQEYVLNDSEESDSFACDICGNLGYNCDDDLTQHNNEMHIIYSCDQCDFEAFGKSMMDWHTSTSHLNFSCDECEFIAKNKGGLTRHRNAKHENTTQQNHLNITTDDPSEQVYKCDECDYQSGIDYHVNSHINDFHRANPVGLHEDLQEQESVDLI